MNHLRLLSVVWACLALLILPVQASNSLTEQQLSNQIVQLSDNGPSEPMQLMAQLRLLQQQAQQAQWPAVEVMATSRLANLLTRLERFDEAEQLMQAYRDVDSIDSVSRSYLLSAKMYIASSRNDLQQFTNLKLVAAALAQQLALQQRFIDQGKLLLEIGNGLVLFGQNEEALPFVKQASRLFQAHNDQRNLDVASGSLANIHSQLGNNTLATQSYLQLLNSPDDGLSPMDRSVLLYNVGASYKNQEDYVNAQRYLQQARALSVSLQDEIGVAYVDLLLAEQQLEQQQYQHALNQLEQVAPIFTHQRSVHTHLELQRYKAQALLGLNRFDEAEQLLDYVAIELDPNEPSKGLQHYFQLRYQLAEQRGQYQQALAAYQQYADLKVTRADKARESTVQQLMVEFGVEQAAATNKLLEQNNQLKQGQINQVENEITILYLLVIVGGLISVSIVLFWYREVLTRRQLQQMAMQDFLTGAPNRRAVIAYAKKCLSAAIRNQQPLCIAIVDLDHFKRINDNHGHDVGDKMLQRFSHICATELRNEDQFGRFGGEEWLLVFPGTQLEQLPRIFERLRSKLQADGMGDEQDFTLTFSMGGAQWHNALLELDDLIKAADDNVYQAKQQGRDRLVISAAHTADGCST
ncbi:diguanylate cyclase [uncultured Ferrimonas sp.]|uniref:diguanylate cyclase n=1 Tax=uncultured Ferrimonas sp. TaxID=432640 RepID=UPI0026219BB8|nr:diguanylate cyclase [uncultured Ferrimonas sp.]